MIRLIIQIGRPIRKAKKDRTPIISPVPRGAGEFVGMGSSEIPITSESCITTVGSIVVVAVGVGVVIGFTVGAIVLTTVGLGVVTTV